MLIRNSTTEVYLQPYFLKNIFYLLSVETIHVEPTEAEFVYIEGHPYSIKLTM
jgi:hypothetical protein